MPSPVELYDGELRSRAWWRLIRRYTAVYALLISLFLAASLVWLDIGSGSGGPRPGAEVLLILALVIALPFLAIWPALLGLAMIAPRLSVALLLWNGRLVALLFAPAVILFVLVAWPPAVVRLCLFAGVFVLAILLKTAILYYRHGIVASGGRQQLPT